MSYCRWSSDDFRCDVYCYAHVDGTWTIHVAGSRYPETPDRPPAPSMADIATEGGFDRYKEAAGLWDEWTDKAVMEQITLQYAGETFKEPTPAACAARLELLRAVGYHVPQYAIDALREEATA